MKRIFFILLMLLIIGCYDKNKQDKLQILKYNSHYIDEKQIDNTIKKFIRSKKLDYAYKFIDTLMYFNKQNGFLYYEKGFVEGYNFQGEAAMKDFKTAQSLNFDRLKCQTMMDATQIIINAKIK